LQCHFEKRSNEKSVAPIFPAWIEAETEPENRGEVSNNSGGGSLRWIGSLFNMKKILPILMLLGLVKVVSGASVGGIVRPSQLGNEMIGDTLIGYLSTGRCTLNVPIRGIPETMPPTRYAYNDLNMEPLPNADDTVAFFEGVSPSTGAWIKIKNPNYTPGATCQFPDVAPTDASGEHNVMIDMKKPQDLTGVGAPGTGDWFFLIKKLDDPIDSVSQLFNPLDSGYSMHISNLSFINHPKHSDDLIAKVRREYAGLAWEKTDTVTMDTTKYWAAYVVPRMTLTPEDSVVTGIKENQKPTRFTLSAWPNPFNSAVTISAPSGAEVEIFDVNGRRVAQLPANNSVGVAYMRPAGGMYAAPANDEFIWTPNKSLGSGVYLVRARFDEQTATKRVVYLK